MATGTGQRVGHWRFLSVLGENQHFVGAGQWGSRVEGPRLGRNGKQETQSHGQTRTCQVLGV